MTNANPFAAFAPPIRSQNGLRRAITAACRRPEEECISALLPQAELPASLRPAVRQLAEQLILTLRDKGKGGGVEALIQEFSLSSEEGVALMCLAEALLRIPDTATRDALIRDKIAGGDWKAHLGDGRSLFINAATWGLIVTGKLVSPVDEHGLSAAMQRLVARTGEPVVRRGMDVAMRMMGEQFVAGQTIGQALKNAREYEAKGFTYSYDMLGEAAATADDAERYFRSYESAIAAIGRVANHATIYDNPGISVKLSALHPRYERAKAGRMMDELLPRLRELAMQAKSHDIGFNIDAEEADRAELSLDLFESLALDPELAGWDGLGFVVQAYGKRCPAIIDWLIDLARRAGRRIPIRLVKGAYWDSEIKHAQTEGLSDFPVFTRKVHSDISYIACARKLLGAPGEVYPQFATHNVQTLATIYHLAGGDDPSTDYEFQCLHGMGEALYEEVVGPKKLNRPCRIYAPVGTHDTLLAYLVRRLLENGANSSFVHRLHDPSVALAELIEDPVAAVQAMERPGSPNDAIAPPADILGERPNSMGLDLTDEQVLAGLAATLERSAEATWHAQPETVTPCEPQSPYAVLNPADNGDHVGTVAFATEDAAREAMRNAAAAAQEWAATSAERRADMLEAAADIMQDRIGMLMGLAMREAGKTAANAVAEVREAIDFLRYYAAQARETLGAEQAPLGPVVCISPWNFPLAIFTGQVAAALAAGNPVVAKPAEETPLIAAQGVAILHEAGIPRSTLQFLPGAGEVGAALVAAPETAAVMFTGSTEVARLIQKQLADRTSRQGKPIPLIAETGGLNCMIVDSSALPEQVVRDVVASAFDSAGQRCSALRILCAQDDVADRIVAMLKGAMDELSIGNPTRLSVDVGPVITAEAKAGIENHIGMMREAGHAVTQTPLSPEAGHGHFVPPTLVELNDIAAIEREVFGPVLHVVRYKRKDLGALIDAINASGYGLTFGLHSRLDGMTAVVTSQIEVGNIYVNRNIIGAMVGVQPFGGRGLSGTGPKAGGPIYLQRLVDTPAPLPTGVSDPALAAFAEWLESHAESETARMARRYDGHCGNGFEEDLPGPVGERNRYTLRPRGLIALYPATDAGLYQQLAAVLATGNRAAIEGYDLPADMPQAVLERIGQGTEEQAAAALIEGGDSRVRAILCELAERPGAIIPAQAASSEQCRMTEPAYAPHWLIEEVATSTDTTAAGGNASLMMIG